MLALAPKTPVYPPSAGFGTLNHQIEQSLFESRSSLILLILNTLWPFALCPYPKARFVIQTGKTITMKQLLLLSFFIGATLLNAQAQSVGSFEETISFNATNHTLAFYVPMDYDSTVSYPLVVALHGCGGSAISFRNGLSSISDSLDAIILCPDFMGNQMSGTNGQIITDAIDTTIIDLGYNIDTSSVYLVGFSCNGQETFKQGWNDVYPFVGIIPFNSWIPSITTEYNFDAEVPTCICTGDQDPSYPNNLALYDSLIDNGGTGRLNSMPGIGHVWTFANRDNELMECFNWIDSLQPVVIPASVPNIGNNSSQFAVFPNPVEDQLNIKNNETRALDIVIYDMKGTVVFQTQSARESISINTSEYTSGIYLINIKSNEEVSWTQKFIVQ